MHPSVANCPSLCTVIKTHRRQMADVFCFFLLPVGQVVACHFLYSFLACVVRYVSDDVKMYSYHCSAITRTDKG